MPPPLQAKKMKKMRKKTKRTRKRRKGKEWMEADSGGLTLESIV